MDNSLSDITQQHGREMYQIALKHALEMAKLYRDNGDSLDDIITHLEKKMAENVTEHSRFDEEHRQTCEECTSDYLDFVLESKDEARLDNLSE